MRQILAGFIALNFCLVSGTVSILAETDNIDVRIEALRDSAEKARVQAARQIQIDADRRSRELDARLTEVKKWTSAQFELSERGVIDKPKVMTELLSRWQTANERQIYVLLQHPEKSQGSIESGRALNSLLARVGPAALQNQQTRKVDPASALPIHASSANEQISEDTFNHLTIQDKVLGPRDGRRGNAEPIDIDWPAILREDRWATYRAAIERTRKQVLDEMSTTNGITPAADKQLRDAVGALNKDFIEYRKHWRDGTSYTPDQAAQEIRRVFDGNTYIRKLIASVYFIVQAKSLSELPQHDQYHGGNIEEFFSYMVRNNLEFGTPSKPADRNAYYTVFNLMVRYYLDENAMTTLRQQLEQELDQQKEVSRQAIDVALGKTLSAETQAALSIERMKFIRDLIKD